MARRLLEQARAVAALGGDMAERTCATCGVELVKKPGRGRWPKYCAPACRSRAKRAHARSRSTTRANVPPVRRPCPTCGAALSGPMQQRYCSAACRRSAQDARERADGRHQARLQRKTAQRVKASYVVQCSHCGETFVAHRSDRRYCSRRCSALAQPPCSVEGCGRPRLAKGLCKRHYNRQHGFSQGMPKEWIAPTERFRIYERDGWRCGICRRRVDPNAAVRTPMSATLDHVVPRSEGGSDDPSNLRLAHMICNATRRDGGSPEQLALVG